MEEEMEGTYVELDSSLPLAQELEPPPSPAAGG